MFPAAHAPNIQAINHEIEMLQARLAEAKTSRYSVIDLQSKKPNPITLLAQMSDSIMRKIAEIRANEASAAPTTMDKPLAQTLDDFQAKASLPDLSTLEQDYTSAQLLAPIADHITRLEDAMRRSYDMPGDKSAYLNKLEESFEFVKFCITKSKKDLAAKGISLDSLPEQSKSMLEDKINNLHEEFLAICSSNGTAPSSTVHTTPNPLLPLSDVPQLNVYPSYTSSHPAQIDSPTEDSGLAPHYKACDSGIVDTERRADAFQDPIDSPINDEDGTGLTHVNMSFEQTFSLSQLILGLQPDSFTKLQTVPNPSSLDMESDACKRGSPLLDNPQGQITLRTNAAFYRTLSSTSAATGSFNDSAKTIFGAPAAFAPGHNTDPITSVTRTDLLDDHGSTESDREDMRATLKGLVYAQKLAHPDSDDLSVSDKDGTGCADPERIELRHVTPFSHLSLMTSHDAVAISNPPFSHSYFPDRANTSSPEEAHPPYPLPFQGLSIPNTYVGMETPPSSRHRRTPSFDASASASSDTHPIDDKTLSFFPDKSFPSIAEDNLSLWEDDVSNPIVNAFDELLSDLKSIQDGTSKETMQSAFSKTKGAILASGHADADQSLNKLYEAVWVSSPLPPSSKTEENWGEKHLFDDLDVLIQAVQYVKMDIEYSK